MKCMAGEKTASKHIRNEVDNRIKVITKVQSACAVHILLDKFGFTPEDAARFLALLEYNYDSVCQGYISFEDIINTLKDEHGLDLRFKFK